MSAAWHAAALHRTKRMPALSTLLKPYQRPIRPRAQTPDEMSAVFRMMAEDAKAIERAKRGKG